MTKDFGAPVGYLEPDGRAFEQVVWVSGRPAFDTEFNLAADLKAKVVPSGWVSSDALDKTDSTEVLFTYGGVFGVQNQVEVPTQTAVVKGWTIPVQYTNSATANVLDVGAPPAGVGAQRTDVVVLEVWRKLLDDTAVGKSASARLWRNGNVKVRLADDALLNFPDDLVDPNWGNPSTRRVQIQYRLRCISGVDVLSYPRGLDDPTVLCRTAPTDAFTPDGAASLFPYSRPDPLDPDLFVAGDGNPANGLGTVDGYVYALPLMALFRRNSSAFDRNSNHNGSAAVPPGASDRPDLTAGADPVYATILNAEDVWDMRACLPDRGRDYVEVAEKNFNWVLSNQLKTSLTQTLNGGGVVGHTVLWADEIGILPGDGTVTGDTPGATFIRQFDGVCRRFSDAPVYETVLVAFPPAGAAWTDGEVVVVDMTSFEVALTGTIPVASRAPVGTLMVDVVGAYFQGHSPGKVTLQAPLTSVTGLGGNPVNLTLGTVVGTGVTDETLYVKVLLLYPSGSGTTWTPTRWYQVEFNNIGAVPADYATFNPFGSINFQRREVPLQYVSTSTISVIMAKTTISNTFDLPGRAYSVTSILVNGVGRALTGLSADGYTVTVIGFINPTDTVTVTWEVLKPFSDSGLQVTLWYQTRAPQTIQNNLLGTTTSMVPRWIGRTAHLLSCGSSSLEVCFPYPYGYVQTGGILSTTPVYEGEHQLRGSAAMTFADFDVGTGYVEVPTNVSYRPLPEDTSYLRTLASIDIEGRTYFEDVSGTTYYPAASVKALKYPLVHKVLLPMLFELTADTPYGTRGQLVFGLMTRWSNSGSNNVLAFDSTLTNINTVLSLFKVKGNL